MDAPGSPANTMSTLDIQVHYHTIRQTISNGGMYAKLMQELLVISIS